MKSLTSSSFSRSCCSVLFFGAVTSVRPSVRRLLAIGPNCCASLPICGSVMVSSSTAKAASDKASRANRAQRAGNERMGRNDTCWAAPPPSGRAFSQIRFPDLRVSKKVACRVGKRDRARLHDVAAVCDFEREPCGLLDEQDGDAERGDLAHDIEDL